MDDRVDKLTPMVKKLLQYMIEQSGDEGLFSQMDGRVAQELGISRKSVVRGRSQLIDAGLVKVIEEGGGRGRSVICHVISLQEETPRQAPSSEAEKGYPKEEEPALRLAEKEAVEFARDLGEGIRFLWKKWRRKRSRKEKGVSGGRELKGKVIPKAEVPTSLLLQYPDAVEFRLEKDDWGAENWSTLLSDGTVKRINLG